MHLLMMISAAFAQEEIRSLADEPDHDEYVQAVLDLDMALTIRDRPPLQILPGLVGVINTSTLTLGNIMAMKHLSQDSVFIEAMPLRSSGYGDLMNSGFRIRGLESGPDDEAEIDSKLDEYHDGDQGHHYVAGVDPNGEVGGAKFLVSNNLIPDPPPGHNEKLDKLTPLNTNLLSFFVFDLKQDGKNVGWLLRERRNYGSHITWVDHWYYRDNFGPVTLSPTTTLIASPTTLTDPNSDGVWTMSEFLIKIKALAPPNTQGGLALRQVAIYRLENLHAVLTP